MASAVLLLLFSAAAFAAPALRVTAVTPSEVAAFQAALPKTMLGLPPDLHAALLRVDPAVPAQRLACAPLIVALAQASSLRGDSLLAAARGVLVGDAAASAQALAEPGVSVTELQDRKAELDGLEAAALRYGADAAASQFASTRARAAARIAEALGRRSAETADGLGRTAGPGGVDGSAEPARRPGSLLKRAGAAVVSYFREPPPPPRPLTPALEAYRRFQALELWSKTAPATRAEIERLRRFKNADERKAYLREEGEKIMAKLRARFGTSTFGFHYNMHGGQADQYVDAGIQATLGDRITNRNENVWTFDSRLKVFFLQSPGEKLYDILDTKRMDSWPLPLRMGDSVMIFDLEDKVIVDGFKTGKIGLHTRSTWNMSYTFDGMPGIPYSAFVMPPIEVFRDVRKKLGTGRLSRDEETLAAMRVIEAAAEAGSFVPRD
ncbi:MAG: hypothetical protein HY553_03495 [Elusimicrobia bacterium]|nr:hypothetical protein [Elusimicrobiota bacterium]